MNDTDRNIMNERRADGRPSNAEIKAYVTQAMSEQFAAVIRETDERTGGTYTADTFRKMARSAFEEALNDAVDDEKLNAGAHETLEAFEVAER